MTNSYRSRASRLRKRVWRIETIDPGKVSGGRVVFPAGLRKEFGIEDSSEVVFSRTAHGIEIKPLAEVVRSAQSRFARSAKVGVSVVDELICERREAAEPE